MKKGITKITSCIVISLVILAGFTVMFSGTMDVQGENEKEEENMYYQFVQNVSIEENETYSEEDIEEELELLIEALGLDDGPRTNSEVDIMEWFASLDEDDWEALLDMDEDMEADGCGPVRHDTNGAEGPREREDEIEYNSPPGQINGGGGGGSGGGSGDDDYDDCPSWSWATYLDCYEAYIDAGYSEQDASGHCAGQCFDIPYPPDEDEDEEDDQGDYSVHIYTAPIVGVPVAARVTLTEEATSDFAISTTVATTLSQTIVYGLILSGVLTGGVSVYLTGTYIAYVTASASVCDYRNERLALYWVFGVPQLPTTWCR